MAKINKTKFRKAMKGTDGILADIARNLKVSRSAITQYVQKHEDIRELLREEEENMNDLAESKLFEKLESGDLKAIMFRLESKARLRGYGKSQEISLSGGLDNTVKVSDLSSLWAELKEEKEGGDE